MSIESKIRAFAGSVILISLGLAHFYSPYFLWVTAFVGANLFQSSFTKVCPLRNVLKKMEK